MRIGESCTLLVFQLIDAIDSWLERCDPAPRDRCPWVYSGHAQRGFRQGSLQVLIGPAAEHGTVKMEGREGDACGLAGLRC